jgi:RNA polymerase sigma-70 factor (sigma-E family)
MRTSTHAPGASEADEARRERLVEVYRAEHEGMVRLAHLLTGSTATAEDVVQDAFLRLHDVIDEVAAPGAYLRRIVVNLCHSHHRRRGVEDRWRSRQALASPALPPDVDEMWTLLQELPTRQREVLVLRFYLDLRVADVAAVLGIPVGTVKSAIHRGLAALSSEIAP